jgi:hypothetical protein
MGQWTNQKNLFPLKSRQDIDGLKAPSGELNIKVSSQQVDHLKPYIMACILIFWPGISEPCNQIHFSVFGETPSLIPLFFRLGFGLVFRLTLSLCLCTFFHRFSLNHFFLFLDNGGSGHHGNRQGFVFF